MLTKVDITFLPEDEKVFSAIADMCFTEWSADKAGTIQRLQKRTGQTIPFVLLAYHEGKPIGIAALDNEVNLFAQYAKYKQYGPWLTLFYVLPEYRNNGVGSLLYNRLEAEAFRRGITRLYMHTKTEEPMFKKLGWKDMEHINYKSHDNLLLYKDV